MSLAKITILGFNSYLKHEGEDLFKNLVLPSGIDRDTLVNNILNETAEFEVLYSNPYYMQELIGVWSNKHQRTWQKWIDALNIEYDPLYNYDRHEEWSDESERKTSESTSSDYENNTEASATTEDSATTTNKVSAYDSNTFSNDTQSESGGEVTNTSTGANTGSNSASSLENEESTNLRTGRAYGNIGVTTSQQMLESELDIATWNIYQHITDMFIDEFMIAVYV